VSKNFPKLLFVLGIAMLLFGMVSAGVTFKEMRRQRHLHDRLCGVKLRLSEQSNWQTGLFAIYERGSHTLYLSTLNAQGKPLTIDTMNTIYSEHNGEIEARIINPQNTMIWSKQILLPLLHVQAGWSFLDSINISHVLEGEWKLEVRVTQPDVSNAKLFSELVLMPPQILNIGSYIHEQSLTLIFMGALMFTGFCTIVLGGYLQRRTSRRL